MVSCPAAQTLPNLLYAQVVKRREKGRVVAVTRKIILGEADEISARLAASTTSTTINTSFVERDNLTWREHNRRLTRKTAGFSKELPWMESNCGCRWPTTICAYPISVCVRNYRHGNRPEAVDHHVNGDPSPQPWQLA